MQRQESSPWASTPFGILILLGCWCLSSGTAGAATLAGKITALSSEVNGPLITLKLENADGSLVDQRTAGGSDGRFEFDHMTKSEFRLRADAPGYQSVVADVNLTGVVDRIYLDLVLLPLAKIAPPASDLPALTDESAPKKARQEYEKGSRALQEQKPGEAMLHFEKAVAEYPCYARAQTDLARALVMQNKIPEAETALKKSITCDGGFLEAYTRLAVLLNGTKRYSESEKVLEEGLRRAPSSWNFYFQLGATHSGLGEYDKAEADYLKARSLNPAPPTELHVRLADLYHRMKAYDKAFAEMQAYLRDDPNGRFAARTRAVMQEMESSGLIHAVQNPPPQPQP
jgi:tetratricopeptide (TPR) repeat protein